MKNVFSLKSLSVAVIVSMALLASCSKSDDAALSSSDSQTSNSESVSASTSSEASDLGNSVISNVSNTKLSTGRVAGPITGLGDKDPRLTGATITITGTGGTKDNPSGIITIDYGTDGITTNGVTRKGQIIIVYSGQKLQKNSTRIITFNNYYRNSVKVEGTYDVTVSDSTKTDTGFEITFDHVTALTLTFPDNTTIVRNATFTSVWDNTPLQSTVTHKLGGAAEGTNRAGKSYVMAITKDIVYRADCFAAGFSLPISGTKTITIPSTQRVFTIDYGTTTCDNTVTITVNGRTVTVTVNKDGN